MAKQNFKESDHLRGQPGNRGQFAPKPSVQAEAPSAPAVDLSVCSPETVLAEGKQSPLASFTTSDTQKEETRKYITETFIPSVKTDVEHAWKEWAARPTLPTDHFENGPWSKYDRVNNIPIHNADTSESDLDDQCRLFMYRWLNTRCGEFGLGNDMIRPEDGEDNAEVNDWFTSLEYDAAIGETAELDDNSTLLFVEVPATPHELLVGYYYLKDGEVAWEYVENIPYLPPRGTLKDNWQRWADEFDVEPADT